MADDGESPVVVDAHGNEVAADEAHEFAGELVPVPPMGADDPESALVKRVTALEVAVARLEVGLAHLLPAKD